ncbi:MAG: lipocalin family protein [Rickettsiales bacterium]
MKVLNALVICSLLSGCYGGPVGNAHVPQPAKAIDLTQYLGRWFEIARYENGFEKGCEGVTADYTAREDGLIGILNTCRKDTLDGVVSTADGKAKIVEGSNNAKLKVSFFGPFYVGDYWVLDRADDYSWSIVGEPSGRYLWILSRKPVLADKQMGMLITKVKAMGYDTSLIYYPKQPPVER